MSREYTLQRAPHATAINIDYAADLNEQRLAEVTALPGPLSVIRRLGRSRPLRFPIRDVTLKRIVAV